MLLGSIAHLLPHVDASFNVLALACLLFGLWRIRRHDVKWHRRAMLAALACSLAFLAVYLTHHAISGSRPFPRSAPVAVRWFYWIILATHVTLAALVPFLAIWTAWLGLTGCHQTPHGKQPTRSPTAARPVSPEDRKDRRERHRRWARVTFPIWVYVSVTGVIVYVMLYWLYSGLQTKTSGL